MSRTRSTKEIVVISLFWLITATMIVFALINSGDDNKMAGNTSGSRAAVQQSQGAEQQSRIAIYQGILQKDPNNIQALIGIGDLYFNGSQYKEAIAAFQKASEIGPPSVHVENDLGLLGLNTNDYDTALIRFKKALDIDPGHMDSLYYIGVIYQHKGKKIEAKKAYEQVLTANPSPKLAQRVQKQLAAM